ncbi:MAG: ABC transporter permease [Bacteroidota bacterium]|jgi:ABC-2 type transport system permease protein|nr:ABC transporter permease [Bacteroidota bacterium]OQC59001.1 MAG: Inner membrane transport permease YbhS [Bacteroidetes bacterium ADurb.Bin012]HOA08953.1 ABC transporter permease [Tenuifilaceae bacterium]HRC93690.1 ABC transporter permease [Tenuifilaceae bacterium]HRR59261.1 ABC transporter permease [Paludibacteraceae bacterium]
MKAKKFLYSQFFAFVKKEFYHIFRDKRTMLILLVMPIVQIILFGFAITTEVKNTPFAVFDMVKNEETRQIIERLAASEHFSFAKYLISNAEIDKVSQKGEAKLAVVFKKSGNSQLSIQLIADATDPNQANTFANYASAIINQWEMENLQPTANLNIIKIIPQIKMLYNPQMKGAYNFVPGVMGLVLILICAMMTSISIVREKEIGTMEILLVSPVKPIFILLAKITPYFVLSVINLTTILLLSVFVIGVPIAGSLFMLIALSLLFIFVGLSLGLLVSNMVKTQVAAILISVVVMMMPTMLLSGMIFPIDSMPKILQWISVIPPNRWYAEGVIKIMIQGVEPQYVVKEFAILGFMAVVLITVSLKKFNIRIAK